MNKTSELLERIEICRRTAERGLNLATRSVAGAGFSARIAHTQHVDLWQHLLNELRLVKEAAE